MWTEFDSGSGGSGLFGGPYCFPSKFEIFPEGYAGGLGDSDIGDQVKDDRLSLNIYSPRTWLLACSRGGTMRLTLPWTR